MEYVITLSLGKEVYQGTGKTALEALAALPKPAKLMQKATLTITDGTKSKELYLHPTRLKRLFYNPKLAALQVKQLTQVMK